MESNTGGAVDLNGVYKYGTLERSAFALTLTRSLLPLWTLTTTQTTVWSLLSTWPRVTTSSRTYRTAAVSQVSGNRIRIWLSKAGPLPPTLRTFDCSMEPQSQTRSTTSSFPRPHATNSKSRTNTIQKLSMVKTPTTRLTRTTTTSTMQVSSRHKRMKDLCTQALTSATSRP